MALPTKTRRRLLIALAGLAGAAALVLGGTWLYVNVFSADAPDPFVLDSATPGEANDDSGNGELILDGTWAVADGSEAGYRVDEVLNGLDNTVVGRTPDVTGEIVVADGAATSGEVVVDMTTVTTDSNSRDGQFQGSIMNTDEYPTSTFTLTEPVPVGDLAGAAEPITLTASGELTIRDVTREVEARLDLQQSGDAVQVAGSVPITFAEFEVDPPNLAFVRVEDEGLVEFLLTLTRD
ncbi:YceI family protein [Phytoactinopolyspora mesophila]|uniref:YceI family protein n=1 Tax=Phytoactinopolyspora mesophila TaxID=2650750 RepID=A0A7K3MAB2_9ACTN|nr:YceI family protein [Phytoactinopolyspora mesophila]NDL60271.1 YceI family protein [Phytoactinopolyspora mesophila]